MAKDKKTITTDHPYYRIGRWYFETVMIPRLEQQGTLEALAIQLIGDNTAERMEWESYLGPDGKLPEEYRHQTIQMIVDMFEKME